jgi:RNA polymerase sigma factor for flagellar operon FliA
LETAQLWAECRSGDGAARALLIEQYVRLAEAIARGMRVAAGSLMDADDVRSAASLGLIDAVDRFDPSRGVPFEAYAAQRIRGAVIDEVRRIGDRRRTEDAASAVRTVSLDDLTEEDWHGVPAAIADDLDVPFENEDLRTRIEGALAGLPPRQREVLARYYAESLTLRETGQRMGISEARACQLHGKAIQNLRQALSVRMPRMALSPAAT